MEESGHNVIEIQRNELAEKFNCVPSQINYVLTTRFTINHGFVIESRRGGGGYVRIVRIPLQKGRQAQINLFDLVGEFISQKRAEGIISRFYEEGLISPREARIMRAAIDRKILDLDRAWRESLRADLLKTMIAQVLLENREGK